VFFMKKMKYILIAILVLPATLLAQSTEEVAERYLNAIGGEEAIVAFSESKMVGSMSMMGMNIPVTMYVKSPGKVRVESQVMGQSIIQATNGETAWMINPMMGSTAPQKVSASEVSDAGIGDDVFLHMGEEGYSFEYKGESTIDGADYYHIYIEAPSGKQDHYYSKDTGLRVMVESKVTAGPSAGSTVTTYFSDYKEIDGYKVPHSITAKTGGSVLMDMTITTVEKATIDDSTFEMPEN